MQSISSSVLGVNVDRRTNVPEHNLGDEHDRGTRGVAVYVKARAAIPANTTGIEVDASFNATIGSGPFICTDEFPSGWYGWVLVEYHGVQFSSSDEDTGALAGEPAGARQWYASNTGARVDESDIQPVKQQITDKTGITRSSILWDASDALFSGTPGMLIVDVLAVVNSQDDQAAVTALVGNTSAVTAVRPGDPTVTLRSDIYINRVDLMCRATSLAPENSDADYSIGGVFDNPLITGEMRGGIVNTLETDASALNSNVNYHYITLITSKHDKVREVTITLGDVVGAAGSQTLTGTIAAHSYGISL